MNYGIKLSNTSAWDWTIISGNTFECNYPIYSYFGWALVSHNTISNALVAIYAYGNGNGNLTVYGNLVNDSNLGIGSVYYNTMALLGDYDSRGHNRIAPSGSSLYADYQSAIEAGDGSISGYNSFYGGGIDAQMVAGSDSYILAQGNWWNGDLSYSAWDGGWVDFSNPLTYDPNGGMPKMNSTTWAANAMEGPPVDSGILFDADITIARDAIKGKEYDRAILLLAEKFSVDTSVQKRRYVLARLADCYRACGKVGFLGFLETRIRPLISKSGELYLESKELEGNWLLASGDVNGASAVFGELESSSVETSQVRKHALFNLANIWAKYMHDASKLQSYVSKLQSDFPNDMLIMHASMLAANNVPPQNSESLGRATTATPSDEFSLVSYPNPFNPSTTLRFKLPVQAKVTLAIYDILGREVTILANGSLPAGEHSLQWNATTASSGIYFARFMVTDEFGRFISSKVHKLLIMR